ncbi:MAG: hypothetical protein ACR2QF_05690 [Geminicoccaceae bacterium]
MCAKTRNIGSSVAALLMLAGCSISDPSIGTGPVALGPAAEEAFADYQAKSFPRYFALSEDGSAFYYTYCPDSRCLRKPKTQIIHQCETFSRGIPCKIYAHNGKVVWTDNS